MFNSDPSGTSTLLNRIVQAAATVFTKRHAPLLFGLLVNMLLVILALAFSELTPTVLYAVAGISVGTLVAWGFSIRTSRPRLRIGRSAGVEVSDVLIFHGRRVCEARRPKCELCAVSDMCPSSRV